jgi:hypothetical protein
MLTLEEYEKLNPRCEVAHEGVSIVYATPNNATRWRVDSLFTKGQVEAAERKSGAFKGCAEYVFRR